MNPEVRVLLERANARRISLLGLVDVIPAQFWSRREDTDSWTARQHLAHVATADELLLETLSEEGPAASYESRRSELLAAAEEWPIRDLLARMERERARLAASLDGVSFLSLDGHIQAAGVRDAWGREAAWPVRALLAAWAEHDTGHELAIRRAVTSPPAAAALSAAARRRR